MKFLATILFSTFGFVAVNGDFFASIECYECLQFGDPYEFEPDCLTDPASHIYGTCGYLSYQGRSGVGMCTTLTGVLDGTSVVRRGCMAAPSHEYDGKCVEATNFPIPTLINKNASYAKICYCAIDRCNNSSATSFQLQHFYIALFAVLLWYSVSTQ